ncbi:MAG TPA: PrgI family protein [Candidatus Paceibacterota bacterium]|nr:PrgI family protein [Candidatus Paceibacterota bacterium]
MQFQVPQFIETEDKVVGPFSIRQFAYVGVACLISAIFYFMVSTWLAVLAAFVLIGGALALSFVKIEGRPLVTILTSAANFYWKPQTYVWKPESTPPAKKPASAPAGKPTSFIDKLAAAGGGSRPSGTSASALPHTTQAAPTQASPSQASPSQAPMRRESSGGGGSFEDMLAGVLAQKWEAVKQNPATAASIAGDSSLHKSWQSVQTGEVQKMSSTQLVERTMNERYQILQKITGDRTAAKRVDYR